MSTLLSLVLVGVVLVVVVVVVVVVVAVMGVSRGADWYCFPFTMGLGWGSFTEAGPAEVVDVGLGDLVVRTMRLALGSGVDSTFDVCPGFVPSAGFTPPPSGRSDGALFFIPRLTPRSDFPRFCSVTPGGV